MMAIKKDLKRRTLEDEALEGAMGVNGSSGGPLYGKMAAQDLRARRMTPAQRKQAQRDQKRNKKTYDLPEVITSQEETLAEQHGVPPSHLVALLLKVGLQAVEDGQVDVKAYRVKSPVPRYEWFLNVEVDDGSD